MYTTIEFRSFFSSLLKEVEKLRCTHRRYDGYSTIFRRYLCDIETVVDGHFYECAQTSTGDVVDTCSCRHYLYRYPYALLQKFLFDHHAFTLPHGQTIDVTLTIIMLKAKILGRTEQLYERYAHIIERHLEVAYGRRRTNTAICKTPGCQCIHFSYASSYDLLKTFLLDNYVYKRELYPAEYTPCISITREDVYKRDEN